jgi:hypothetical protein|tara:strand:- start:1447 stop:1593 length:147 start_codon:yes stop_codon:yes gene_type:complete
VAASGAAIAIDAATARSAELEAELLALRQRSAPAEETRRRLACVKLVF